MPDQPDQPSKETSSRNLIRPDPMFKAVTRKAAMEAGLELLSIELPQLLRADLMLAVPEGKDLSDTLFDFLSPYSIIEFKSKNDTFDQFEFAKNLARTHLFFGENKQVSYNQLLTVFVCAEQPDKVLDHLKAENTPIEIDEATPWLLRCRVWSLEVAIVICRLLPLKRRFYHWLLFAPAGSVKWRDFVTMLIKDGERDLLEQVKKLNLKEFKLMTLKITEGLEELSPEERAEYEEDWLELIELEINGLEKLNPKKAKELFSKLKPEQLLAGLTPERLAGLTPEQRQKFLELLSPINNQSVEENQ
jgi:hypothetical protein